jgi:N-acetylglucosamine kinase-like BadF-type ATPase
VSAAADVVLVGVDSGATKSKALAVRPGGAVVGRADGGGASPKRQGLEAAGRQIAALAGEASGRGTRPGHGRPALVYIAGAGIDRPEHARALEREVARRLPGTRVMAANDTMAVLRCAAADGVGLAVPVSTGGNVVGRGRGGRMTDRGHGIFGGAYVMGALAARAARRGGVSADLAAAVEAARLTWLGRRPDPSAAQLGAAVAAAALAGDPYPARIVERWCGRVTAAVREEVERLGLGPEPTVVVYGGLLAAAPWLGDRIRAAVLAGAPGARLASAPSEPVEGAALLARDAWAGRVAAWDFVPRR